MKKIDSLFFLGGIYQFDLLLLLLEKQVSLEQVKGVLSPSLGLNDLGRKSQGLKQAMGDIPD